MAYLTEKQLTKIGFKRLGKEVRISDKSCIYDAHEMEIGDFTRIDDFCIVSGKVQIGSYCHVTPMCLLAGGEKGIFISDFCTLAYGVKIFSQTDDYSGETMVNSLIPKKFKREKIETVRLEQHVIVGTNSVIMPGVTIKEGCSIGAMTLIDKNTLPWGIYVGAPARRMRDRKRDLLKLKDQFLEGNK